jgi:hypothetical protein
MVGGAFQVVQLVFYDGQPFMEKTHNANLAPEDCTKYKRSGLIL